jgi:hypothetical protein
VAYPELGSVANSAPAHALPVIAGTADGNSLDRRLSPIAQTLIDAIGRPGERATVQRVLAYIIGADSFDHRNPLGPAQYRLPAWTGIRSYRTLLHRLRGPQLS